jgi:4-hydroxymandelate synthase
MAILGIDHVEFYVADVEKSAAALCRDFGFWAGTEQVTASGGRSVLLRQGSIKLLLTAAEAPGHPAADYVQAHGDGVASIAFLADDVRQAFADAVGGGARPIEDPVFTDLADGRVGEAVVSGFGDVTHRLIEYRSDAAEAAAPAAGQGEERFTALDHAAICLPAGELEPVVRFYEEAFGLSHTFDERIEVGGQAMISKVVQNETGSATFTLIEPDAECEPGQIDQFLDAHGGAGVQHLALRTADIAEAVRALSSWGVEFLTAPAGYYRALVGRLGDLAIPVEVLQQVNVLADRDQWGQLFQIFSRSTHERRTFFVELVERHDARTFGSGNIKALYEALHDAIENGAIDEDRAAEAPRS